MDILIDLKHRAIVKAKPPLHIVILVLNVIIPGKNAI
jgi:hypothetical protein